MSLITNQVRASHRPDLISQDEAVSAGQVSQNVLETNPSYTYREYHDFVQSVLCSAGLMLQQAPENDRGRYRDPNHFDGRNGSTLFEKEFIKGTLMPLLISASLAQSISLATAGQPLHFLRFEDPERGFQHKEAASRAWADLFIIASDGHEEIIIPVNIKYTKGSSADNLCGWDAIDFVLYGNSLRKSKKTAFLDRLTNEGIPSKDSPRDYFFWSFQYEDNSQYLFSKISTYSLLSIPVELLTFNSSQSFPVQFSVNKLNQVEHASLIFDMSTFSLQERKRSFLVWLLENRIADDAKTSQQNLAAYSALIR